MMYQYKQRRNWKKIGKEEYRSRDGRFRIFRNRQIEKEANDPIWELYDISNGDMDWKYSFKECRLMAAWVTRGELEVNPV